LYGSRPVVFAHDEVIAEVPVSTAHEAAHRLTTVMIEASKPYLPNVRMNAAPALMRRWLKDAEAKYVDGRLVPWEPEKKEG
jgi:hypothetical protein